MIKNVVFDLDGFDKLSARGLPAEALPGHTQIGFLRSAIFGSPEWLMLDRGVIDQAEAEIRLINQHPQFKKEIQAAFADWFSMLTPIEENAALLPELKGKGCGLYVISNFHTDAFAYIKERYSWFKLFDGMIISCDIRCLSLNPGSQPAAGTLGTFGQGACLSTTFRPMWKEPAEWAWRPFSTESHQQLLRAQSRLSRG